MPPCWQRCAPRGSASSVFAAYSAFTAAALRGEHPDPDRPLIRVERPEEVPSFASEDEEHEYWGTHDMGDAFYEDATLPSNVQDAIARIRKRRASGAA